MRARVAHVGLRIWKEKKHAVWALMLVPGAVAGEVWACDLDGAALRFAFDRGALYPGIEGEPPRRVLGEAVIDGARFMPEPFVMPGGTVGFHEDAGAIGQRMLVIAPDGAARYSDTGRGLSLSGRCGRLE